MKTGEDYPSRTSNGAASFPTSQKPPVQSDTSADLRTSFPEWQKRLARVEAKLDLLLNGRSSSKAPEVSFEESSEESPPKVRGILWGREGVRLRLGETENFSGVPANYPQEAARHPLTPSPPAGSVALPPILESEGLSHCTCETSEESAKEAALEFNPELAEQPVELLPEKSTPNIVSKPVSRSSKKRLSKTPTEPLNQSQLAKRLRSPNNPWKPMKPSAIARAHKKLTESQFIEWSRTLDPQKVGWCCGRDGMYYPLQ